VAFLRDASCSDGMSDTAHPTVARVSFPDGRLLAGCCRNTTAVGQVPAGPAPAPQRPLQDASWRLVSLTGQGPEAIAALPRPVVVRFTNGNVSGFSGCNNLVGSYTVAEGTLRLGAMAGTQMACAPREMAFERAFRAAFTGSTEYAVSGDRLTVTTGTGTVLSFRAELAELRGVTWQVNGYNNGRQAVVSLVAGSRITMRFANGVVSGDTGCGSFRATYSTTRDRVTIGQPDTTGAPCSTEVSVQAQAFLAALRSAVTWRVQGGALDMHAAGAGRALTASGR
jgi:heat shock protein HslJ